MKITKIFAAISAAAVLAVSASFTANAVVTPAETEFSYRITPSGKAVITEVTTSKSVYDIPATVKKNGKDVPVVGVDDFAFALCDNLKVINVPDSLTIEQTGDIAFLNSTSVMDYLSKEFGETKNIDDVIKYVAKKTKYKNGNYTDEDLTELALKIKNKIDKIDLSAADDVAGKTMILLKSVDDLDISAKNRERYKNWINLITYSDITLAGSEKAPMKEYAKGKELLGLKYQIGGFILGDANGDGECNVRDAAFIAKNLAKGVKIEVSANPAADFNQDKAVNVRDAAAIAKMLAGA